MKCDCETDPIGCLKHMFVEQVQQGRIDRGQNPARRPVFLRLHGVAHGTLTIEPKLAPALRIGLFADEASFPAWVRFSSDIPDSAPEKGSTCGVGIKLFDVPGEKLLGPDRDASTADLLFQNHDVFFVDNAKQMCAFTQASLAGKGDEWLVEHPETAGILDDMRKDVASVLGISYWSVIAFGFGEAACKFVLVPDVEIDGSAGDAPDALAIDLQARLQGGEARFS